LAAGISPDSNLGQDTLQGLMHLLDHDRPPPEDQVTPGELDNPSLSWIFKDRKCLGFTACYESNWMVSG
jgi:hypothetical protein